MTINITVIVAVPGGITFTVRTDADGCDEDFSTTIEGTRFASHLKLVGAGPHPDQRISTNPKSGPHVVTVIAETSHVSSRPTPVVLIAVEKGTGG
jgi:hypothetical protein